MNKINKQRLFAVAKFLTLASFTLVLLPFSRVLAETTTTEKIQNEADEAGKEIKKGARKVKKKVRDATGNESITEDIKDAGKNVGDEIKTKAKKIERRVD